MFYFLIISIFFCIQIASAAHYIVGYVEDAKDSTSPNGRQVRLWNPSNGQELFETVGPNGASMTSNVFMVDCEMLSTPCKVNDILNVTLVNDGSGYMARNVLNVTVTGYGYDVTGNLTMNSPPTFINLTVEDSITNPENELDMTPNTTTHITCSGLVKDYDSIDEIEKINSTFYSIEDSSTKDKDDKNKHYSNNSCSINKSYGQEDEAYINCSFEIEYYANAGTWNCQVNLTDNMTASTNYTDSSYINPLLAIGVDTPVDFGEANATEVSEERTMNVTNYGNIMINLSLSGYGATEEDGNSMDCSEGGSIPIYETKYNLTASNIGAIDYSTFKQYYTNLSSTPVTEGVNLNSRQNDTENDAIIETYWRIYMSKGVGGTCQGNIVFSATQG